MLEQGGAISDLRCQVRFEVVPRQYDEQGKLVERAVHYVCDFAYYQDGQLIVEDVKSEITRLIPDYVIKRKLMLKVLGIRVKEIL